MKKKDIMKKKELYTDGFRNRILGIMAAHKEQALSAQEIAELLEVRHGARKHVRAVLEKMTLSGELKRVHEGRYAPGQRLNLISGNLFVSRSGNGFVTPDDGGQDVALERGAHGTALPGDRVTLRLNRPVPGRSSDRRSGTLLRVEQRSGRAIVGTLKFSKSACFVTPIDSAYSHDFHVGDPKGAQQGDRVVVRFSDWASRHANPDAEIMDVLGPADRPSLDTLAIIRHYGLAEEFSKEAIREAEEVVRFLDAPGSREDLRNSYIITIDPERARDFDDAISLERNEQGLRVLGVHIADVAHFVRPGTALDSEARQRGTSVYFPDRVLPMLPETISNGLCSLRPGEDRFAFSVFITFNDEGVFVASRFARSIIRSRHRLSYEQALLALEAPAGRNLEAAGLDAALVAFIKQAGALSAQLRSRRFGFHALDLDVPEYEVIMGDDSMIKDVVRRASDQSHQLIEEFMIAANEAVDRHLSELGFPLLHRVHEPPAPVKIEELTARLKEMGFEPGDLSNRANLAAFLRSVRGNPFEYDAQMAVLRSLKRAVYSPKALGHFGLAKKFYAHFTSPIRRYPDLVAHRILAAALEGGRRPYEPNELAPLAIKCSESEQNADAAEKALIEIKKYRLLEQVASQTPPRAWDALVVNTANFGMFVELVDLQIQGLVRVSSLSRNYVQYDPRKGSLKAGTDRYVRGVRLKVRVVKVDFDRRQIEFALADNNAGLPEPAREQTKRHAQKGRQPDGKPFKAAGRSKPWEKKTKPSGRRDDGKQPVPASKKPAQSRKSEGGKKGGKPFKRRGALRNAGPRVAGRT